MASNEELLNNRGKIVKNGDRKEKLNVFSTETT
jgi:hypothetical protein